MTVLGHTYGVGVCGTYEGVSPVPFQVCEVFPGDPLPGVDPQKLRVRKMRDSLSQELVVCTREVELLRRATTMPYYQSPSELMSALTTTEPLRRFFPPGMGGATYDEDPGGPPATSARRNVPKFPGDGLAEEYKHHHARSERFFSAGYVSALLESFRGLDEARRGAGDPTKVLRTLLKAFRRDVVEVCVHQGLDFDHTEYPESVVDSSSSEAGDDKSSAVPSDTRLSTLSKESVLSLVSEGTSSSSSLLSGVGSAVVAGGAGGVRQDSAEERKGTSSSLPETAIDATTVLQTAMLLKIRMVLVLEVHHLDIDARPILVAVKRACLPEHVDCFRKRMLGRVDSLAREIRLTTRRLAAAVLQSRGTAEARVLPALVLQQFLGGKWPIQKRPSESTQNFHRLSFSCCPIRSCLLVCE